MTPPRALVSVPWTLYAIDWSGGKGWETVGGVVMPPFTFGKRTSKSNPWQVTLVIPKNIKALFASNLLEAMKQNRNYWPNLELRSTERMEFKAEDSASIRIAVKGYGPIAAFESR